ncbi:PKD domain-containing protein [Bacteroidia bacterium]|nr:PKD domain-containing protein [Bacteroidia bacterium]
MKKTTLLFLSLALILGISSCKPDDEPTLGTAPTKADAAFTYAASTDNDNIINFIATNAGFTYSWDFDNGTNASTKEATAEYPNKGTYTVTLTVFNSGGSASSSQDVIIAEDDASLLSNPKFTLLTGGAAGSGSKTWVIDSTRVGHFGVGDLDSDGPIHYSASPGDKANSGLYSDRYVFTLTGFKFDHITNGSVFINNDQMSEFPGSYENSDDATAPFQNQTDETWVLTEGEEDTTITISGQAFIGFYTGSRTYEILNLSENELYIKYTDSKDATLSWFIRLVPEDFPVDGGGGGGGEDPVNTSTLSLPFNFEAGTVDTSQWEAFGGSTLEVVDNTMSSAINTSTKAVQTIHGEQTWAGLAVTLKDPLDFSGDKKTIAVKVYAPTTGEFRIKLEDFATGKIVIEEDVMVTKANEWQEISIDFSEAATGTYDKIAIFPGWNIANAGTFLIDDISQK